MTKRNLYLVHREMRLYSILAYDEDCALNLRGEVLDTVYLGIHGNDVKDTTTKVLKNTLAVKREFKKDETDFVNYVAFGKTAELLEKYTQKGSKLLIQGRLQIGSYEKDGIKRQTADVIVENIEFIGGNKQNKESDFLGDPVEQEPLPF